jgi:hypothetical protein
MRAPKLEALFIATFALFGFRLGARPISDNSMLTHLRTGIDIARSGSIPRTDPYSFTAAGRPWVVQSWLPEWTYGWAYRLGGNDHHLVVLQQAVLMAVLAWLVLRLARTGSPLRTAGAGLIAVGIGAPFWSPRPLVFGLICMALMVWVVERRRSPWLLVPIVWLWVNSHGSFPLGLAWLAARAAGEALDWRAWPGDAVRYVSGFAAGVVVSVLNPLGVRLLAFPLTLAGRRDTFAEIVEWMSPDFQKQRAALLFLSLAMVLLVRARLSWRDVVPSVTFLVAGLLALRNLPLTAVVLAPVLGRILRQPDSKPEGPTAGRSERVNRIFAVAIATAFVVFGASIWADRPLNLDSYPQAAVRFVDDAGLLRSPHRLAHPDFVGNYLELRYGRQARVFIDDRYDMFPPAVARDYRTLLGGRAGSLDILERRQVDVVLWEAELPLAGLLEVTAGWREVFRDEDWVVFRREG